MRKCQPAVTGRREILLVGSVSSWDVGVEARAFRRVLSVDIARAARAFPSFAQIPLAVVGPSPAGVQAVAHAWELRCQGYFGRMIVELDEEEELQAVDALAVAADDVFFRSTSPYERAQRVAVCFERPAVWKDAIGYGPLRLELCSQRAFVGERELRLSDLQRRVLAYLCWHAPQAVPEADLRRHIWGTAISRDSSAVRKVIGQLRLLLADEISRMTIARGYRLRLGKDARPNGNVRVTFSSGL